MKPTRAAHNNRLQRPAVCAAAEPARYAAFPIPMSDLR